MIKEPNPEFVRQLVVQIKHIETGLVKGTGFLISADGKIITCNHVLQDAAIKPVVKESSEVRVNFLPFGARKGEEHRAKVIDFLEADDVAVLKLIDGAPPRGPNNLAQLWIAECAIDRGFERFKSYGFKDIEKDCSGLNIDGTIRGLLSKKEGAKFIYERVQIYSSEVDSGVSGAPVVMRDDCDAHRIIGIIIKTYYPDKGGKNQAAGFAVDAKTFLLDPFKKYIHIPDIKSLPTEGYMPETHMECQSLISPNLKLRLVSPYPVPYPWIERIEPLKTITDSWRDENIKVLSIIGPNGNGKTSLVRKWGEDLMEGRFPESVMPKVIFWWSFDLKPDADEFFLAVLNYLSGGKCDQTKLNSTNAKMECIGNMVHIISRQGRCLFILDGLDKMQDENGCIRNENIRKFIFYLIQIGHCIVTSKNTLNDFKGYIGYMEHSITCWSKDELREVLKIFGLKGSDMELDRIVNEYEDNFPAISLIGKHYKNACDVPPLRTPLAGY